ncbi:ABC transporter ATP-binding protein [Promicromonospora sp. NPDC060271]|uniref:ABC transporter ATP-binding protein n=1 Tax=Promicromonospora sp. NPDC060271 TaxID=3347089 RepID=UPI003654EDAA
MIRKLLVLSNEPGRKLLRRMLVWVVATAVLQGAAFVALAPFLAALLGGDASAAGQWLIVLTGLGVAYAAAFWVGGQAGNGAATEVLRSLLDRLGDRLVELPVGWFAADRSGELADVATRGIVFASTAPYAILRPIITAFVTPATVLVGALLIDWRIALTMACAAPVMWFVYRWLSRRLAEADREHVTAVAHASSRLIELARVQPALRAAGDNTIAQRLVDDALRDQHAANRRVHVTGGAGIGLFGGVVQLAVIAVVVVGVWLALGGELAVASLVPLLVLGVRFVEPITHSGALGGGISIANNTLDRVQAILDEPTLPEPTLPEPGAPAPLLDHAVRFDHVTFGYGAEPVLRDLSFEAPAGAMTAVVGPSGSGKTTITRLVARFYDPERGTVSIGGVPLTELGSDRVAAAVAPVFQDVYLFDGTILDNIWLGSPGATREQAVRAGEQARVDEIAARVPGGWDARVGEGGTNLSGGERQRVSIARALLKDAPIVLLDEATAALDVGNEQAIGDAFTAVRENRTLIVVAHRLQTIATADRIIMLDGAGGIAEQGTHAELVAAGGAYARYWHERVDAAGWRLTGTAIETAAARPAQQPAP